MNLNITHYNLEGPLSLDHFPLLSADNPSETLLGLFDHFSGLTLVYFKKKWPGYLKYDDFFNELQIIGKQSISFDKKLDELIKRTAFLHEVRHFHDCFCTPFGTQLLEDFTFCIGTLQVLCQEIIGSRSMTDIITDFPIAQYFSDHGCPEALQILWKANNRLLLEVALNIGASPIAQLEGLDMESDFYIVNFKDISGIAYQIPCANLNIEESGKAYHLLWPLGFCLLAECLAVLEQEAYINGVDYKLTEEWHNRMKRQGITPYSPMIATFTRLFRRRGIEIPDTNVTFDSIARSFFLSRKNRDNENVIVGRAGWELIRLLQNYLEIENGRVNWEPPLLDRSKFIKKREQDKSPLFALVEFAQESYLNKAMAIEEISGISFTSRLGYTAYFGHMPIPPLIITLDGEISINDPDFYQLWLSWMFYIDIVQTASFGNLFICALQNPIFSKVFMEDYLLPDKKLCKNLLGTYKCGIWKPSTIYKGPKCFWTCSLEKILLPFGGRFEGENTKRGKAESPWKSDYESI